MKLLLQADRTDFRDEYAGARFQKWGCASKSWVSSNQTFFSRSAMSIPPTLSVSIGTILNPAMTALAGLVPCALFGMTHIWNIQIFLMHILYQTFYTSRKGNKKDVSVRPGNAFLLKKPTPPRHQDFRTVDPRISNLDTNIYHGESDV